MAVALTLLATLAVASPWTDALRSPDITELAEGTGLSVEVVAVGKSVWAPAQALCDVLTGPRYASCAVRALGDRAAKTADEDLVSDAVQLSWVLRPVPLDADAVVIRVFGADGQRLDQFVAEAGLPPRTARTLTLLAAREADLQTRAAAADAAKQAREARARREQEAMGLLNEAGRLLQTMDIDGATSTVQRLKTEYGDTRARRSAAAFEKKLASYGIAPPSLQVARFVQGTAPQGAVQAWLFFDPTDRAGAMALAQLQEMWAHYGDRMAVAAFTTLPDGASVADLKTLIRSQGATYPVAVETGAIAEAVQAQGAEVVVFRDGALAWRGHPARFRGPVLDGWL